MTAVVQTVAVNGLAGVSSKTVTLSATQSGNSIIVTLAVEGGATRYTGFTVTDNQSNTYTSTDILGGNLRTAAIFYKIGATAGVTSLTVTPTGGSGGLFGAMAVQEVSGLTALDKHASASSGASSPLNLSNSGTNTGTADFVTTAIAIGTGIANVGIANPPTGYTTSAISQNDSTDAGGACAYRIDTSAVLDTVSWTATGWEPTDPAVIASFVGSAAVTVIPVTGPALAPMTGSGVLGPLGLGGFALKRSVSISSAAASGTSTLQFGQTGTLTGLGALTGTSALTFGQSGAIAGQGALTGTSALTFGQSGTLIQPGLQGTSALVFGQSGTLAAAGTLAGTSALQFGQTAVLAASGVLAGSSALTIGQSGTLIAAGILAGVSALTFAQTAALVGSGALAGSSGLTFSASATADVPAGALSGTASLTFDQSATLNASGALQGLAVLVFGAVCDNSIIVSQPGPVDSPRIAEGAWRRKKKKRAIEQITEPAKPAAPEIVISAITAVPEPAKATSTISLAEAVSQWNAPLDESIDIPTELERDDQEALRVIFAALGL